MIRSSLSLLCCLAAASLFTPLSQARDTSQPQASKVGRVLATEFGDVEFKEWDVVVFKYPIGSGRNYIKRLKGLPIAPLQIDKEHQRSGIADVIKAKGSQIKISDGTIQIEGGKVEIQRTIKP